MSATARDKAWMPTTDDVMRWFSPPPAHVVPQMPDEQFSDYLARTSIRSFEAEIDSEQAARRWLAEHDAEIRAAACADVLAALTEERIARALWYEATEEGDDQEWTWDYLVERANRGDGDYSEIREGWFRAARAVLALIEQETSK